MQTYSALIDIGKNGAHNHVPRGYNARNGGVAPSGADRMDDRLTAAEVMILRHIHGADSVLKLEPITAVNRSPTRERERLERIYGPRVVRDVFGPPGAILPKELDLSPPDADEDESEAPPKAA